MALPLHLLFGPKQGRYNTNKADLLIFMLSRLKAEFAREVVCPNQRLAVAPFLELKKSKRSFRTREALYFQ
jgi:hypothetical protein